MSFEARKRSRKLEQVLDESSTSIERHLRTVAEAQRNLEEILAGKSVLLVDTTLNNPRALLERGVQKLHDRGWGEVATLYIQKLFGGALPEHTGKMFQQFLGPGVDLVRHDIRSMHTDRTQKIDALFFSGSPADVSKALATPSIEVRPGISHGDVYERTRALYREAAELDLPVAAMCYGHDVITAEHGGTVDRTPQTTHVGLEHIHSTDYGSELLVGVIGVQGPLHGRVAAFHSEAMTHDPSRSALLLHTSNREPAIVHGLLHIRERALTGNAAEDIASVRQLFADRRHVSLTVQSHPEYTGASALIAFAIEENPTVFEESNGEIITADMLRLFTHFFAHYGKAA